MKFIVTAKPRAKKNYVKKCDDGSFIVAVREPAREGKANDAIVKALAAHLGITPSRLKITSGLTGKRKVIEAL